MSDQNTESGREDNQHNMGCLIAQRRKSQHMTQRELADMLHITDKAVSKWERGLSCPDISILTPLAQALGITANELLSGEEKIRNRESEAETTAEAENDGKKSLEKAVENTLVYAQKAEKRKTGNLRALSTLLFSCLLLLGIVVCVICDLAISGALTWSWYPISSILLSWLVTAPAMRYGKKGITVSLAAVSVLIFPFLFVLQQLVNRDLPGTGSLLMTVGGWEALIALGYLWSIYAFFHRYSTRKWKALAFSLAGGLPVCLLINLVAFRFVGEPWLDVWDFFAYVPLAVLAILAWEKDRAAWRKASGSAR